jgi:Probable taurine catabolism dioxygenase
LHSAEALVRRNNEDDNNAKPIASIPSMVSHPVVRTHPETGRKALYVNPYYTESFVGWTPEESRLLIDWLMQLATRQENIYRHSWRQGRCVDVGQPLRHALCSLRLWFQTASVSPCNCCWQ